MLGQVDAHGLGGHLILPDGLEGPAIGGVDQQHHDPDAHCHQQEGHKGGKAQHHLPIGVLDVEAGEGGKALQRVGAVGDRAQPVPLEDGPDDLRKAQGGDGQVVALQPQHRQADKPGDHRRHTARQDQRRQHTQDQTQGAAAEQLRQGEIHCRAAVEVVDALPVGRGNGQNGVGVGAQQHEARLPQGEQARKAVQQVQGGRHQRVHSPLLQHGEQHTGGLHGVLQHNHQDQQGRHAAQGDPRAPFALFFLQHRDAPFTLCRWTSHRTGRWASPPG